MKDSGVEWIGKVPIGWEVRKLSDVAERITDFVASGSFASLKDNVEYLDEPDYAMLVRTVDLSQKMVKKPVFINESAYNFLSNSNLFGGELILPNIGSVGDVYKYVPIYQRASLAPNAVLVDMKEHNQYYYYYFLSPSTSEMLKNIGSDSVQLKFNKTQLRQIRVLRPRSDEQIKIAEFLDKKTKSLSNIIEQTKSTIEDYKLLKQSIITEAVTKGLDKNVQMKDSGNKWIGQIPKNWSYTSLKNVLITPITDGPHETPTLYDEGFPFVSAEAIKKEKVDFSKIRGLISTEDHIKFSKKVKPVRNDIFMVKSGATTGNIGIVETDDEFSIWSPLALIRANTDIMLFKYLYYYLQSKNFRTQVEQFWNYGTQQNIGMKVLGSLQVIVPNILLQKKIADYLDDTTTQISHLIEKKEGLLVELEKYKKSLIYEYVTGKKEVE